MIWADGFRLGQVFAKINVDAAPSKNTDKAAVSAVARNSDGGYLQASAVVFQGQNEPETLIGMPGGFSPG
jgi:hypothetical protein